MKDNRRTRVLTIPITGGRMVFIEHPVVFSREDLDICRAVLPLWEPIMIWGGEDAEINITPAESEDTDG